MTSPGQETEQDTGSPAGGEPDLFHPPAYLVVGKLRRPHGVKGEMIMDVLTDFPERLRPGRQVFVGEGRRPLRIRSCRPYQNALLVYLEGISTPEAAGEWRNALVAVRQDEVPELPEGEYYHHQVLGMRVVSEESVDLGIVAGILETGANDVIVVRSERGNEILIPMADEFVLQVDLAARVMRVHLIDGMG